MELTKEMFQTWRKGNPATVEVFHQWELARQQLLEELGSGATVNMDSADNTLMLTVLKVGQVQGMDQLLNTEFTDPESEEDE